MQCRQDPLVCNMCMLAIFPTQAGRVVGLGEAGRQVVDAVGVVGVSTGGGAWWGEGGMGSTEWVDRGVVV